MATSIDELQIEIQGTARSANTSINRLVKNLDNLQGAIGRLDTSKFKTLSVNTSNLSTNTTKLASSFNTLNTSAVKSTKSVTSLAAAFGKFYANFFLVIRGIKSLWNSIEGTADYIEAFNYYTVAFGKVASEWDKDWEKYGSENAQNYSNAFVTSMNETLGKLSGVQMSVGEDGQGLISSANVKSLGLNIQEITQYASQLASVTNSLGQTGETTLAVSKSFTQLAGDISSLFNVDYSTVANNLQSGLIGQSRALYKYGIDITNATLQTYAYELGLEKTVTEMTQMEKQQLRVLAILDQAEVSFGDLANTINSPSNQIRQLTNNLEQCGIVLGQLFMPIVEKVLPVVNGLTIAIRQLLVDMAGFMGITIDLDAYGEGFNNTEDDIDGVTDSLDEATESANALKKSLRGFDKLNVINTTNTSSNAGTNASTIDLTSQIVAATEEYQKVWNEAYAKMENKAEEFAKKISGVFSGIGNIFDFSNIDLSGLQESLSKLSGFTFDTLHSFYRDFLLPLSTWTMSEVVPSMVNTFSKFVNDIDWDTASETISSALQLITQVVTDLGDSVLRISEKVLPKIAPIINNIVAVLQPLLVILQKVWSFVSVYILPLLESSVTTVLNALLMNVETFTEEISLELQGLVDFIDGVFSGDWEKALEGLNDIFGGKFKAMYHSAKDTWDDIKEYLDANGLIEKLNLSFAIDKVDKVFKNFPTAAKEAFGNVVNVATDKFNSLIDWLNKKLTIKWDGLTIAGQKIFDSGSFTLFTIPKIPKFETGGFPEDGLFFANHNELVGKFSNGQTAVANNEQIVDGIAKGVSDANAEQNALLREQNALLRQILAKDMGITSRDVFNAVRSESSNYTRRTGQPAFG